ncbi:MAG: hypothetical protein ABIA93_01900 [Candidatus Woesearchaeota archaeon]
MEANALERFDHILLDVKHALARKDKDTAVGLYQELKDAYSAVLASGATPAQRKACYVEVQKVYLHIAGKNPYAGMWFVLIPFAVVLLSEFLLGSLHPDVRWGIRLLSVVGVLGISAWQTVRFWRMSEEQRILTENTWLSKKLSKIERTIRVVDRDILGAVMILFVCGLIVSQVGVITVGGGMAYNAVNGAPELTSMKPGQDASVISYDLSCAFRDPAGIASVTIFEDSSGGMNGHLQTFSKMTSEANVHYYVTSESPNINWYCQAVNMNGKEYVSEVRTASKIPKVRVVEPKSGGTYTGNVVLSVETSAPNCVYVIDRDQKNVNSMDNCSPASLNLEPGVHEVVVYGIDDKGMHEAVTTFTVSR